MEDQFSQVASLIGDPARAKIMWALLDGRAYTATELANYTGTSPQNISMHLGKLVAAALLSVEKQGRHRYYNYARPEVSYAIEALANLVSPDQRIAKNISAEPVRYCRTCYDHLAGKIGVGLTQKMLDRNLLIRTGNDFQLGSKGAIFYQSLNIDIASLKAQKRSFARACLDWSERKPHLAGSLGAAILDQLLINNWVRRAQHSRAIIITGKGRQALFDRFGLEI